jgi:hypothetical protein
MSNSNELQETRDFNKEMKELLKRRAEAECKNGDDMLKIMSLIDSGEYDKAKSRIKGFADWYYKCAVDTEQQILEWGVCLREPGRRSA